MYFKNQSYKNLTDPETNPVVYLSSSLEFMNCCSVLLLVTLPQVPVCIIFWRYMLQTLLACCIVNSVLRSRSLWSRNYLRPGAGAGAGIIFLINIYYSKFDGFFFFKSFFCLRGGFPLYPEIFYFISQ